MEDSGDCQLSGLFADTGHRGNLGVIVDALESVGERLMTLDGKSKSLLAQAQGRRLPVVRIHSKTMLAY